MDYQEYLQSDHWLQLKLRKSKTTKRCFICKQKPDRKNFHHVRYKQLFDVTVQDVRLACEDCHRFYHAIKKENSQKPERSILKLVRKLKRAVCQPGTGSPCSLGGWKP